MPVSAEQFREILSKLENSNDLLEYHASAVNAEKEKGILKHREVNAEAQRLRKFKIAFEKMGYDPSSQADIEEFSEGIIAKMEQQTTKSSGELAELQKTLKKLQTDFSKTQTELAAEREQKIQLEKVNKSRTIESKLLPKLQESFYGANFIVKALLSDGSVDLDDAGEVIFKKGDTVMGLDEGLKLIGDQNADARKNKQAGGAGSSASTQPAKVKYSMEQIKAMDQKTIQANITDVNESMRQLSTAK